MLCVLEDLMLLCFADVCWGILYVISWLSGLRFVAL